MTKKVKKNNLGVINENELEKDEKNKIDENEKELKKNDKLNNLKDVNGKKTDNNEEQIIEGTYLIGKEKVNNIKFLKKVKYYKGVISYKYIYDSFLNGELLDLNEQEIFNKYKLQ